MIDFAIAFGVFMAVGFILTVILFTPIYYWVLA